MRLLTFLLFITHFTLIAQDQSYHIKEAKSKIIIDGILNDEDWSKAQVTTGFSQYFPSDSITADDQTEVMFTYDDKFFYFAAKMYTSIEGDYVIPSLKRDFMGMGNDGLTFVLDAYQDNTSALVFGVNPFGVQREGTISNGGSRRGFSLSWDNKWFSESKIHDGYWVTECAIPLKTLRYKDGSTKWNINFYRIDSKNGEVSTMKSIPRNYAMFSLAYMRELIFDKPLKKPGANISLIPFVSAGTSRDFENVNQSEANNNLSIGGDAKIGITSSMNLDLTVNPDFSQVEVDEQVTNLDRFEIFFPEKRQFFLENADLFASFGHPILGKPFFSRRIGIVEDTVANELIQNKINYGARLSGKINNNWRLGVMNMQTDEEAEISLPSINYTVAAVQRKMFARSNIGAIFVNKQNFSTSLDSGLFDYNRVFGVDFNLASADNKWTGKALYHRSFGAGQETGAFMHSNYVNYRSRTWRFDWSHVAVGENFTADVGYVPRKGITRIKPGFGYNFYPKSGIFNIHTVRTRTEFFWNADRKTDHIIEIEDMAQLRNTGRLSLNLTHRYVSLTKPFDPTRSDGLELPENSEYYNTFFEFRYSSDARKVFNYRIGGSYGDFYNGKRYNLKGTVSYRVQPYGSLSIATNYNKVALPAPYNSANLLLIGPRFDLTMTKSLFFTTFVQYNNQIDNLNINSRLQWRFKPASDIFIVYTDNYGTEMLDDRFDLREKNRALVFKMTYWFSI